MKSIILSIAAALMLWGSSAMTSQADAQYVRYNRGYYAAPRYYNRGYYPGPRYYSGYRGYYAPRVYARPYGRPYYNGYYGGGYYGPGVRVGVGPARIGIGY